MGMPVMSYAGKGMFAAALLAVGSAQCALPDLLETDRPHNFHVVDAGRVYRSAQPTAGELEAVIDVLGIRTVLNLRGPNAGKAWYDVEAAICAEKDVRLVDVALSARWLPPPDRLAEVIDALKTAEYPMLIHCNGGADRTGMVSAVYRMTILGHERAAALEELSPEFLHFRQWNPCMDTLAELYEPTPEWLEWYRAHSEEIACQ
jgi:protein tyrosine/serine phosphatase